MLEKYLKQTKFKDFEDFKKNYELIVPENFNFAYDVVILDDASLDHTVTVVKNLGLSQLK